MPPERPELSKRKTRKKRERKPFSSVLFYEEKERATPTCQTKGKGKELATPATPEKRKGKGTSDANKARQKERKRNTKVTRPCSLDHLKLFRASFY